jgi:hypothetical protein
MSGYNEIYDVIVCGGGTSGVAAAIASARAGAKTLLVERLGTLGGQMNVSGPPGFAYARLFNCYGERDVGGILFETYTRLYKAGHALPSFKPSFRKKAAFTFSYVDPEWWTILIFKMMEESGVALLLDTLVVDAIKDGNTVKGIVVENADGRNEIRGRIIIDCTGEAYVAAYAGAETVCVSREEVQPHTIAFTADGVDWDNVLDYVRRRPEQFTVGHLLNPHTGTTREEVYDAFRKVTDIRELGELMGFFELRDMALANGDWHPYSGAGFFIIPKDGGRHILAHFQHSTQYDHCLPTSAWDLTKCHIECRKQLELAWRFFKKYVPGFENAYIVRICTELRLREGPRIVGDYVMTRQDVLETRQFHDTIGKSSSPAGGYHVATTDTLAVNTETNPDRACPNGSYDIPYRCLVPVKIDNLLAAGKCVSTDRAAYLRYLHQTMVTGQAAGVAAAICAKKGITPRELEKDVSELQSILVDQGAILFETVKQEDAESWL